jgi:AcrR family transcriptional regulator
MPLPRFGGLDPEKRRLLMDVAITLFAEKGYEGASLNEILAKAGFGKSSYYYYFADKEDLFATVIEDYMERVMADVPQLSLEGLDAENFWPRLEEGFAMVAAAAARYPEMIKIGRDVHALWHNPTPRLRPIVDKVLAEQRAYIGIGRALGTVRTDIDVDWLIAITTAADQAVDERLLSLGNPSPDELREHARIAIDTFRRLAEPRHDGPSVNDPRPQPRAPSEPRR